MKLALVVVALAVVCGCASKSDEHGRQALDTFGVGGVAPSDAELPFEVEVPSVVPERMWDGAIGLGFIAVLWLIGFAIHRASPHFKHYVLPAVGVAIVAVFFTSASFMQFKSVTVDATGVTVKTQTGGEDRVEFKDVTGLSVSSRPFFPVVTDARELVLERSGARSVGIPFFVLDRDRIGALLLRKLTEAGKLPAGN